MICASGSEVRLLVHQYQSGSLEDLSDLHQVHAACICGGKVCQPGDTEVYGSVVYRCSLCNVTAAGDDVHGESNLLVVTLVQSHEVTHELSLRQPLELDGYF